MNDSGSRPDGNPGGPGSPGGGDGGTGGNGSGGGRNGEPGSGRDDRGDRGDRGRRGGRLRGTGREPGRISRVGGPESRQQPRRQGPPRRSGPVPGPVNGGGGGHGGGAYGGGGHGGGAPRPSGPSAPDPMPAEPVVTREAQALALTAWDLARTRGDREDTPRGQIMTLRTHQKLIAAYESGRRIPEDDRTFLRVRENARASFLLIHGMSTGPADLRGLARHLGENDCNVWVLRLPELGASSDAVSRASWESSLLQARQRCQMLGRGGGKLHVVGLGYGAALAVQLASRGDFISSLVLLAPALMPRVSAFQRALVHLRLHRLGLFRGLIGVHSDLLEGMDAARGRLGRVRVPIYAAQCEDDDRASPASLRFLQKKAQNRASRFQVFPDGGHAILAAHGERVLFGEILRFCEVK